MYDQLIGFIEQNTYWAVGTIFIIALLESIAIIGLFIPGWLILVSVGTLIGADLLPFYPIVIAAYLGAVIGEYISFLIGYRYQDAILDWKMVKKHDAMILASHEFFKERGMFGVFIGRFFGPTRAVVPLIAGISSMDKHQFFWVNVLSGILWAPFFLIPGILVGAAFTFEKEAAYSLVLIITLIVISISYCLRLFNNKQFKVKQGNQILLKLKQLLSVIILLAMLYIFVNSIYWDLMLDILKIVWQKL